MPKHPPIHSAAPRVVRREIHPDQLVLTRDGRAKPRVGTRHISLSDRADPWLRAWTASKALAKAVSDKPQSVSTSEAMSRLAANVRDIQAKLARAVPESKAHATLVSLFERQRQRYHDLAAYEAVRWREQQDRAADRAMQGAQWSRPVSDRPVSGGPRYVRPKGSSDHVQRRCSTRIVPHVE